MLTIGRTATGVQNAKLQEIVHADLWNYASIEDQLRGFDACFFCLGVTSAGLSEADYSRVTYGITMAAAERCADSIRIYVCIRLRLGCRQHGERPVDVGTSERQDRECDLPVAVQGLVCISTWRRSADER